MIEFFRGLSAIEVQYLANMGATLVLFVLVFMLVCRPLIHWIRARILAEAPPISIPSILIFAGIQLILLGLYFRYMPGREITLEELEKADPTITFGNLFLGLSKLEVIGIFDAIVLGGVAFATILGFVNPMIKLAFDTVPFGAQILSEYLFRNTDTTAQAPSLPAKTPMPPGKKRAILTALTIVWSLLPAGYLAFERYVRGTSFKGLEYARDRLSGFGVDVVEP